MLPVQKTIGVIGGGQLGKMLIEASRPWNTEYIVLEADAACPAAMVASRVIVGSLMDASKIRELAAVSDILTFEIEHINVDVLLELEQEGKTIIPSPKVLQVIQDKGLQKKFYTRAGIPTATYAMVDAGNPLGEALKKVNGETIVVKNCKGGYDGKGVNIVKRKELLSGEFQFTGDLVLEEFQDDMVEVSVIVARAQDGEIRTYDPIEMYFNPVSNLVEFLFSPANIDESAAAKCRDIALHAIEAMGGIGIFAVELFICSNGEVLVNEIAPRPHNSGHHTIEGAYTSQFEQLNRILLGLPLGDTAMVCPAAMVNLVGPEGLEGSYKLRDTELLLGTTGVYIHLYNKKVIKAHRKMGHVTILASNFDELISRAEFVKGHSDFIQA